MLRRAAALATAALAIVLAVGTFNAAEAKAGSTKVPVPPAGRAVTGKTTYVVGNGTPSSCTSAAVVRAVARGGLIRFKCGKKPVTIHMTATAKVLNTRKRVVIDGGGKVTLDGGGQVRILYMNTCDRAQVWTTSHCDDQQYPQLVVQNLKLAHGYVAGTDNDAGGGAIFARGGQLKIVNSTFVANTCEATGPDVGGGAVRVFDQWRDKPVYVVGSRFFEGKCSNGAALSSIGVSWVVLNSKFAHNRATGYGANPATAGTPGGGNGGAIALDGNRFTLKIAGTRMIDNVAREGGGAVFFVSNDRTGTMTVDRSTLTNNRSLGFETGGLKGIFFLGAKRPAIKGSVLR